MSVGELGAGGRHRGPPGVWARALGELTALVLPVACAGCELPEVAVCPSCRALFRQPAQPIGVLAGVPPVHWPADLAGFAVTRYEGRVRRLLTGWKEHGRHHLCGLLGAGLAAALDPVLAAHLPLGRRADPLLVVGVPSAPEAVRRRGSDLVADLAGRAVRLHGGRGAGLRVARVLRQRRGVGDQSGLGRGARAANVSGGFHCHPRVRDARVLLVDDIVTTGASTAEAVRAIRVAGGEVVGVAVLAATPRLWPVGGLSTGAAVDYGSVMGDHGDVTAQGGGGRSGG